MLTGNALENFTRRPIFERLMRALVVVKRQPDAKAPACLGHRIICLDIDLLIFQAPPQPFDENIVQMGSCSSMPCRQRPRGRVSPLPLSVAGEMARETRRRRSVPSGRRKR